MSPKTSQDELLERYAQAKATLPDGLPDAPSAALRERIMNTAREHSVQSATKRQNAINSIAPRADSIPANGLKRLKKDEVNQFTSKVAANDSFWNIRALASIAVMGLSALLLWQFENGTPEEQLAVKSAKPSAAIEASAPLPTTLPAPSSASTPPTESAESATSPAAKPAVTLSRAPLAAPAPTAPTKLAQAKTAAQHSSKAETAEIATANAQPALLAVAPPTPMPMSVPMPFTEPAPDVEAAHTRLQETRSKIAPPPTAAPSVAPSSASAAAPRPLSAPAAAPRAAAAAAQASVASIVTPEKLFGAIEMRDAAALRQALAQGASPNAQTAAGNPALTQAVIQRWHEGVRILLAAGANRAHKNNKGHTSQDVALELGYEDISRLLEVPR